MGDIERVMVKEYDGTKEGALQTLKDLKIEDTFYHFNVENGYLLIHKMGLMLRPGDSYHLPLPPEKFEAIG